MVCTRGVILLKVMHIDQYWSDFSASVILFIVAYAVVQIYVQYWRETVRIAPTLHTSLPEKVFLALQLVALIVLSVLEHMYLNDVVWNSDVSDYVFMILDFSWTLRTLVVLTIAVNYFLLVAPKSVSESAAREIY